MCGKMYDIEKRGSTSRGGRGGSGYVRQSEQDTNVFLGNDTRDRVFIPGSQCAVVLDTIVTGL